MWLKCTRAWKFAEFGLCNLCNRAVLWLWADTYSRDAWKNLAARCWVGRGEQRRLEGKQLGLGAVWRGDGAEVARCTSELEDLRDGQQGSVSCGKRCPQYRIGSLKASSCLVGSQSSSPRQQELASSALRGVTCREMPVAHLGACGLWGGRAGELPAARPDPYLQHRPWGMFWLERNVTAALPSRSFMGRSKRTEEAVRKHRVLLTDPSGSLRLASLSGYVYMLHLRLQMKITFLQSVFFSLGAE